MTQVRILVETIRNRSAKAGPSGYVATAFDDVGKLGAAVRTRADEAVERVKDLVRAQVDGDVEFVVEHMATGRAT